ncbi:MAG: DUF3098 domain-containing protein [Rhodothermales bacterium]
MAKSPKDQSSARRSRRSQGKRTRGVMVFTRQNYVLLLLGIALIVVGYVVMRMENEVDGFLSLYVAPLLILGGYLEIIYAILKRPPAPDAAPSAVNTADTNA